MPPVIALRRYTAAAKYAPKCFENNASSFDSVSEHDTERVTQVLVDIGVTTIDALKLYALPEVEREAKKESARKAARDKKMLSDQKKRTETAKNVQRIASVHLTRRAQRVTRQMRRRQRRVWQRPQRRVWQRPQRRRIRHPTPTPAHLSPIPSFL